MSRLSPVRQRVDKKVRAFSGQGRWSERSALANVGAAGPAAKTMAHAIMKFASRTLNLTRRDEATHTAERSERDVQ
jgi:hypothetical protein